MNETHLSYPISPLNFSDKQLNVVFLKQQLDDFRAWSIAQFEQDASIEALVHLRSKFIDLLLERLWRYYQISDYESLFF